MGGNAWYLERRDYDIPAMKAWCEENLTKNAWLIDEKLSMGMFEVVIGEEEDVVAFILRWF